MAERGERQVNDVPLVIDAVPDAARAGDLVLPLLQDLSSHGTAPEIAF